MSGSGPGSEPVRFPEPEPDRPTMAPFLGALVIFTIVVIAIVLFSVFGDNEASPGLQVAEAAVGQNDALQRQDYADFRTFTCRAEQGTEADVLARQRDSVAKNGERYVEDVPTIDIEGDRATATVIYYFDKAEDTKSEASLSFVQEDGVWKVCSDGQPT